MSDHQYKFNVSMTCGGCSGAVERILKRLEGLYTSDFPLALAPALPSIPVDQQCYFALPLMSILLTLQDL
jgi:copper chaperone